RIPEMRHELERILEDARSSVSTVRHIHVADRSGTVLASTDPQRTGQPMASFDVRSGPLRLSLGENESVTAHLSGSLEHDGETLGTLLMEADFTPVIDSVRDYAGLGETGETLLAARTGDGVSVYIAPLRFDAGAALKRQVPKDSPVQEAISGSKGLLPRGLDYRGVPVLAAGDYISDAGWGLVVKMDEAEAFRPITQLGRLFLATLLATSTIVGLVCVALSRALTRPIVALTDAAKRIDSGETEATAVGSSADEVGVLSRVFARMTSGLLQAQRELEQKVEERERAEAAMFREKERAEITLSSIADAVITTDAEGLVEYLNPAAERYTGWTTIEAKGRSIGEIYRIVDESTEEPAPDPVTRCLETGVNTGLAENSALVCRNGTRLAIQDSASPIRDRDGRITGAVIVFYDVTQSRRRARVLSYEATHDGLTGLVNRREFEARLERVIASAREMRSEHVLLYLDLDEFKVVNDTCGHTAGDELLRQIAELLRSAVRKRDTVARVGGDEFAVLLENCPLKRALRIAHNMHETIQDFQFVWDTSSFVTGASVGVVPITETSEGLAETLNQADAACYAAKDTGRNRIHVFEPDDLEMATRHRETGWAMRIKDALENDRFALYYQSIAPLGDDNGGSYYEFLLRLDDLEEGAIPPGAFMPVAERYGLMPSVDRWVIRTALGWLSSHRQHTRGLKLCVINLSGHSLGDARFLDFVVREIKSARVSAKKICFEITETAAVTNLSRARKFLQTLRRLGCRFSLDDFGSGLSSFAYLKTLPVDFLKIDGLFVKGMVKDETDFAIVRSINDMAHVMGKRTIAEWAETNDIVEKLRQIGVDFAQGMAIAEPVAIETLGSRDATHVH
ncbi:MAG TPA: EAL domain-containing protein, partial [Vicinamibacteria bacterium]|nr:EAL domain-containing protein [Vicinamibacteria bacterium]